MKIGTQVVTDLGGAQVNSDEASNTLESSLTLNLFTDCAPYPGPYRWESAVAGDLYFTDGTEYEADAGDFLDNITC